MTSQPFRRNSFNVFDIAVTVFYSYMMWHIIRFLNVIFKFITDSLLQYSSIILHIYVKNLLNCHMLRLDNSLNTTTLLYTNICTENFNLVTAVLFFSMRRNIGHLDYETLFGPSKVCFVRAFHTKWQAAVAALLCHFFLVQLKAKKYTKNHIKTGESVSSGTIPKQLKLVLVLSQLVF